ncbi:DNA topoisomerase (ATP-hydrolyzing) [Ranunculus cassubicifolius]
MSSINLMTLQQMPGYRRDLEDEWTIQSIFSSGCSKKITIALFPRAARGTRLPLPETRPPDLSTVDHPETFARRPKTQMLPFCDASSLPIFDGPLELKSRRGNDLSIDNIIDCFDLFTSASHVLLAPSIQIWSILSALNEDSRYLVIRVTWDRLSYLFIRLINEFYTEIPFVAVTDLDPHQLDLLGFLDTPQHHLKDLYGWDMSNEVEQHYLSYVEHVDIKWLGLRPSDLDRFPANVFDSLALPLPGDFDNILSHIMWNPNLSRWIKELELFKAHRKCVMFQPKGPLKGVVSKRLSEMNWV